MRSPKEIWQAALGELELEVNKPNFRTWLEKTVGLDYQGNRFTIGVPNAFVAEYLDRNQRSLIEKTLINFIGGDIEVSFEVTPAPSSPAEAKRPKKTSGRLSPKYTFDSFIVGSCNRLAHASALAAAQNPGRGYNPLFLYGGVGLGKTHLLQAIGHMAQASGLKTLYVSGEQFTNDFISA
ncbi:MAG: DnaA/Hda family protein, partial [Dehalococcoidales bacterium]